MEKFDSLFKILPVFLIAYGIVATFGNMLELNMTGRATMMMDTSYEMRMLYVSAVIRGFHEFFFFFGLAALVAGLNKRNTKGAS